MHAQGLLGRATRVPQVAWVTFSLAQSWCHESWADTPAGRRTAVVNPQEELNFQVEDAIAHGRHERAILFSTYCRFVAFAEPQ